MDDFDLGEMAKRLDDLAVTGDAITLPFTAPVFWWKNADPGAVKNAGSDVRFFGGWCCNETEMQNVEGGVPEKFTFDTFAGRGSGNTFNIYASRQLAVARIAHRYRWFVDKDNPSDQGRGHVQFLCLAALRDKEGVYTAWNPVVLSYKGRHTMKGQTGSVAWAFDEFDRASLPIRTSIAGGLKPSFFYAHIGTFGQNQRSEAVGKGQKSLISLCYPWPHDAKDFTETWCKQAFVGKFAAALMVEYAEQAQEWLHAWDKDQQAQDQQAPAQPAPQRRSAQPPQAMPPEPEYPF